MVPEKEIPEIFCGDKLYKVVAERTGFTPEDVGKILQAFTSFTKEAIGQGDKVRILDFGTFVNYHRVEQRERNPKTGETITLPASDRLYFKSTYRFD